MHLKDLLAHVAMIFCCSCCSSSSVSHSAAFSASSMLAVSSFGTGSLHMPTLLQGQWHQMWHGVSFLFMHTGCGELWRLLCLPGAFRGGCEQLQVRLLRLLRCLGALGRLTRSPLGLGLARGLEEALQATHVLHRSPGCLLYKSCLLRHSCWNVTY